MTEPTKAEIEHLASELHWIQGINSDPKKRELAWEICHTKEAYIKDATKILDAGYRLAPPAKPAKRCIHGVLNPSDCFECYPKPSAGWPTPLDITSDKDALTWRAGYESGANFMHAAFTKCLKERGIS